MKAFIINRYIDLIISGTKQNAVKTHVEFLGKGENIWDNLVRVRPEVIQDFSNGDIACNSYHKYKEDIALAKELNVGHYLNQ